MGMIKDLYAQAEELIDFGDSHEQAEGRGMKRILDLLSQKDLDAVAQIDWSELRNQKRTLLNTISWFEKSGVANEFDPAVDTEEIVQHLTGILHLIDGLQDFAVDELGLESIHVYDFDDEETRDD